MVSELNYRYGIQQDKKGLERLPARMYLKLHLESFKDEADF